MLLKDYIPNIDKNFGKFIFPEFHLIAQKVEKNNIFLQSREKNFDGHNYIDDAIERGASVIISERKLKKEKQHCRINFKKCKKVVS